MKKLIGATLLGGAVFAFPALAQTTATAPIKCRVAEVNPVTNHAHCIDPVGATLDPQANPCQGMHTSGSWTMTNGCGTAPSRNPTAH